MDSAENRRQALVAALLGQIQGHLKSGEADLVRIAGEIYRYHAEVVGGFRVLEFDDVAVLEQAIHERRQRQNAAEENRTRVGGLVPHVIPTKLGRPAKPKVLDTCDGDRTLTRRRRVIPEDERKARGAALYERRRRQKRSSIHADIAGFYPYGEQVVLGVIALQHIAHGICSLTVKQIARRARVCTRLVQRALKRAKDLGHLAIQGRSRLSSVVTIRCPIWLDWFNKPWLKSERKMKQNQLDKDPPMGERAFANDLNPGCYEVLDESEPDDEALEATEKAQEAAPPVSAPVTATSYGHGPTAQPVPARAPKPGHPAQPAAGGIDAELQAALAKVLATTAERGEETAPEPDTSALKPKLTPRAYAHLKRFWGAWRYITELDPKTFPRVFESRFVVGGADPWIDKEVINWLRENCSAQGVDHSFTHYRDTSTSPRRVFLGFATSAAQMMFDMVWHGEQVHRA